MAMFELNYRPTEGEPYMNLRQLDYFRDKLSSRQIQLARKLKETLLEIREKDFREADLCDRSDDNVFQEMKMQACRNYRHLMHQNDLALRRIEEGTFGYCLITGEEIGLKRLETLPNALLSVDAQEMIENGLCEVV